MLCGLECLSLTYTLISAATEVHDYQTDRGVSDLHGSKCSSRPGPGSGRGTVIVAFCGVTYFEIVGSRTYQIPTKADFLASLLPLICIPAVLSLGAGLFKWKDDNWKLSRGAYMFIIIGLLLLLGAISDIIVTIKPWAIGAAFLLVLLLLVLAIGVIHYWASNNFYLTRIQIAAFLVLYGIALSIEGWGAVASLQIYPPFAGAAVSAITLVVAFGFTVSRPCLTLESRDGLGSAVSLLTVVCQGRGFETPLQRSWGEGT
ncbi:hypothetical protein CQW23_02739 [Capsicum baccatum]|uniref:Calpain-type cysteine protease DEK1 n=1 Tax=Capsicum baccatum TaxID=33114 RepID=A0A2G2XSA5_CAPBA|nr:hypothetical protein CQW23_02739 [Capsicum baccatum]